MPSNVRGLSRNQSADGRLCPCNQCRLQFRYSVKQIKRHLILHPPMPTIPESNGLDGGDQDGSGGDDGASDLSSESDSSSETTEEDPHEDDFHLEDTAKLMLRKIRVNFFNPIEPAASDDSVRFINYHPCLWNPLGIAIADGPNRWTPVGIVYRVSVVQAGSHSDRECPHFSRKMKPLSGSNVKTTSG